MKIDKEIAGLFEDLSDWEYESLKADIKEKGIKVPLVVSNDGTIVCGHQRYKITQELKIPEEKIPIKLVDFKNKQEMIDYAINDNLLRRNLNTYQKALLGLRILPYEQQKAKKRKELGKADHTQTFGEAGEALELVAKKVGISDETLRKVKEIENSDQVTSEIKKKLSQGELSINRIYENIKNQKRKERIEQELMDNEKIRYLNNGNRFSNDLEQFLTDQLNKYLIKTPKPDENKAVIKNTITLSYDWFTIIAKSEEGKRVLSRFIHPDSKVKKIKCGEIFKLSNLAFVIELLNKIDNDAKIEFNKGEPLIFENEHFKIQVEALK